MSHVTIYHNPACGTSRNVLAMIRASGIEPEVIEYLKTPPSRECLAQLLLTMGISARELLREKEKIVTELGLVAKKMDSTDLDDSRVSEDALIDAMMQYPILINRPIVVTAKGVKLCRPSEEVLSILANPISSFTKEDGEVVNIKSM